MATDFEINNGPRAGGDRRAIIPVTYGGRADLCLTLLVCIPVCLLAMAAVNWSRGFI